ncbi:hypothetical protein B9T24_09300 [Acinetobacter sp. ANC 4654]|nr:hypothetical protein B9T24_09300 [Acinetobacter sp. ANC 4654]
MASAVIDGGVMSTQLTLMVMPVVATQLNDLKNLHNASILQRVSRVNLQVSDIMKCSPHFFIV